MAFLDPGLRAESALPRHDALKGRKILWTEMNAYPYAEPQHTIRLTGGEAETPYLRHAAAGHFRSSGGAVPSLLCLGEALKPCLAAANPLAISAP